MVKKIQKNSPDIIAQNGIHWHSKLMIYVKGESQEVPANIGLAGGHQPLHTHSEDSRDGIIHIEFPSRVTREDTKLGNFFRVWNKEMRSFGENMKMTVNGKENTEYENYAMRGGDKIELRYD